MPTRTWKHKLANHLNVLILHEDPDVVATAREIDDMIAVLDCPTCSGEPYVASVEGDTDVLGPCPACGNRP